MSFALNLSPHRPARLDAAAFFNAPEGGSVVLPVHGLEFYALGKEVYYEMYHLWRPRVLGYDPPWPAIRTDRPRRRYITPSVLDLFMNLPKKGVGPCL